MTGLPRAMMWLKYYTFATRAWGRKPNGEEGGTPTLLLLLNHLIADRTEINFLELSCSIRFTVQSRTYCMVLYINTQYCTSGEVRYALHLFPSSHTSYIILHFVFSPFCFFY